MTTAFGTVLSDILDQHGLSQNKAAGMADYDHSYLSRLVSGTRMPTREFVQRFAEGCRLSAEESRQLFEAAGFMPDGVMTTLLDRTLREAAETLDDESIPLPFRNTLRQQISALVGITRQMAEAA